MIDKKKKGFTHLIVFLIACLNSFLFISCNSTNIYQTYDDSHFITAENQFEDEDTISCIFAGDIMAHRPNWSHGRFDEIYEDIKSDLIKSDFVFANFETPVCDSNEYSTYPNFNVHGEYANAAINAGFNVFSLANNHSNDQELVGIKETRDYFAKKVKDSENTERKVYAAGLKNTEDGPFTYQIIEKNGWKILFVAVTEILNRPVYYKWIDYISPTQKARGNFIQEMIKLRNENPCDIFVLSIHCCEEEYVRTVAKNQETFYNQLLEAGIDIIWANHPHVARKWELIQTNDAKTSKMIFYSLGNTISAQRYYPNFNSPEEAREYTGDGFMIKVVFTKNEDGISVKQISPTLLTTFVANDGMCTIKKLNDDFVQDLRKTNHKTWANYLEKRINLMENTKGNLIWQ